MHPSMRMALLFVKNRLRSHLSLHGLRKCIFGLLIIIIVYGFVYINSYREHSEFVDVQGNADQLLWNHTSFADKRSDDFIQDYLPSNFTLTVKPKVLLVYDRQSVFTAKLIRVVLESQRVNLSVYLHSVNKTIKLISTSQGNTTVGLYSLIIFAGFETLFEKWTAREKSPYFNYCKYFNVSMFLIPKCQRDRNRSNSSTNSPLQINSIISGTFISSTAVQSVEVTASKSLYYCKPGLKLKIISNENWVVFKVHHIPGMPSMSDHSDVNLKLDSSFNTRTRLGANFDVYLSVEYQSEQQDSIVPSIIADKGLTDGIHKVFIGSPLNFWLTEVLFLDLVREYSTEKVLRFGRKRWIMVDIDDIFVAPKDRKMTADDVEALIRTQEHFRTIIPQFTFNLGFCGYYYDKGTPEEINGSRALVHNAHHFNSFGHIYNHMQPHLLTEERLLGKMEQNLIFAKNHSIKSLAMHYAVSPHHSGVYPLYPPLYNTWRKLNVSMTTTEEYPHIYPSHLRRGFIHNGILVLPRQTCQLYTHTYSFGTLPGGKESLLSAAAGGEVFRTLLRTPVSVFMTHVTNYAQDRLALLLFSELFRFVAANTQIQLASDQPLALGRQYFKIFPEDKLPLWTNPCKDKRHMDIVPPGWSCSRLPSLLVLGPQKTGSTALYEFLKLHPSILANHPTAEHYEEVQFFSNDTLYQLGIDWYMQQFPFPNNNTRVLFEKSATYFTHPLAPLRAHALIPAAQLIVILHDPIKRAYSWYQHMVAHQNPTALTYKFSEVIRSNETTFTNSKVLSLRNHCLQPGYYHKHITAWLEHFPHRQMHFVDGEVLITHPVAALNWVQNFLCMEHFDYNTTLSFSDKKGFFCIGNSKHRKCLGSGKGRKYPALEEEDRLYLEQHYKQYNQDLYRLLTKYGRRIPLWLKTTTT